MDLGVSHCKLHSFISRQSLKWREPLLAILSIPSNIIGAKTQKYLSQQPLLSSFSHLDFICQRKGWTRLRMGKAEKLFTPLPLPDSYHLYPNSLNNILPKSSVGISPFKNTFSYYKSSKGFQRGREEEEEWVKKSCLTPPPRDNSSWYIKVFNAHLSKNESILYILIQNRIYFTKGKTEFISLKVVILQWWVNKLKWT